MGSTFVNPDFQFLVPSMFAYGIKYCIMRNVLLIKSLTYVFAYFPGKINNTEWSSASLTLFGLMHVIGRRLFGGISDNKVSLNARFLGRFLHGYLLLIISAAGLFIGN
jgi:hypothetical protein